MIVPELKQLQQALDRQADQVQHEFSALSEDLHQVNRRLVEARGVDEAPIVAEQAALAERQQALAAEVNVWRDRARLVQRQPGEEALRAYLDELEAGEVDDEVREALAAVRYSLDHPAEAEARRQQQQGRPATATGRLLDRARGEYDLRGSDPAPRQRAAVEFANRPGAAQNDDLLAELEAAADDPDPHVSEVVTLTLIQVHRFRALRLGDLEAAHTSVRRLAKVKHRAVVPALLEILETHRTGYVAGAGAGQMVEGDNLRSRLVALAALVEWRSPLVQAAVRKRLHDRDARMAEAATRALEVFPGEWK
jgi:hypothetical protein